MRGFCFYDSACDRISASFPFLHQPVGELTVVLLEWVDVRPALQQSEDSIFSFAALHIYYFRKIYHDSQLFHMSAACLSEASAEQLFYHDEQLLSLSLFQLMHV